MAAAGTSSISRRKVVGGAGIAAAFAPGLAGKMDPPPDHGETGYKGSGRLAGRKALITGGDSGMGRAAAIAYAREGADVAINYFPTEEPEAREVIALIKAEGRTALALPGDLHDEAFCRKLVEDTVNGLGGLDIVVSPRIGSLVDNGDGLDLDEPFGQRERLDTYQGAGRRFPVGEERGPRLADNRSIVRLIVHDVGGDFHNVGVARPGDGEGQADIAHRLRCLHSQIAGTDQRPTLVDGYLPSRVDRALA